MHNAAKLKRCLVARRSTGNCNTPAQGIRPGLDKVASDWERIASWRLGHGLPEANCPQGASDEMMASARPRAGAVSFLISQTAAMMVSLAAL